MDDGTELADMSRQLEAGELSPHTPLDVATTRPIGIRQSGRCLRDYEEERLHAAEYAYDTLDAGFIRLVRITQDSSTGGIECQTEQILLQNPPPYTALYYACGSRPANFNIKLNGRDWCVRTNLFRFLRQRLQMSRDPQEWLWIDAIYINQANTLERTHQVRLMADIYGKASRVVAWLGPAYEQSDDAMVGLLRSQGHERSLETVQWILALAGLCSRRYFHRLWVLQELKLAKQKYLMCGSKVISWQHFERFMLLLYSHVDETASSAISTRTLFIINSAAMHVVLLTSTPVGTPLWNLLEKSAHLQCEETRDRVYALCGIATTEAANIDPDYEIDMPVLLNKILKYHLEQVPEISILTVTSACEKLEKIFGTQPGTIFEVHDSMNHVPGPVQAGLLYQRLFTRSIVPGMTLLWALHYEHARVQRLIKMVHRLRSPSVYFLCCLNGISFIVGLPLALRWNDGLYFLICAMLAINSLICSVAIILRVTRVSRVERHVRQHNQPIKNAPRSFRTALEHGPILRLHWWIPFLVHEGLIYVAAPAYRPLKRRSLGFYYRWQGKLGAKSVF
jgi:hypothetical protein